MPHIYTRTDQVRFLTEWFDSWSEMQREDFLPIMIQALNPGDHVNGLVGNVSSLTVGGRRPSLFDCQVKLFQDWYENWTPEERERLLQHFSNTDPDFAGKLHKSYSTQETEEVELIPSPPPVTVDEDKDDGVSPGSHSSSPLSSLSQPLSPHDSGLEESHIELEAQPEVLKENDANQEQEQEEIQNNKEGEINKGYIGACADNNGEISDCANEEKETSRVSCGIIEREV